jgi:hypothetical protein
MNINRIHHYSRGRDGCVAKVEKNPLKKVTQVENPVAASLDHLDLVIHPFHETTAIPIDEIIQDFLQVLVQGVEERIETVQATGFDQVGPASDVVAGAAFGDRVVEDVGRNAGGVVGGFQRRGVVEHPSQ